MYARNQVHVCARSGTCMCLIRQMYARYWAHACMYERNRAQECAQSSTCMYARNRAHACTQSGTCLCAISHTYLCNQAHVQAVTCVQEHVNACARVCVRSRARVCAQSGICIMCAIGHLCVHNLTPVQPQAVTCVCVSRHMHELNRVHVCA